MQTTWKRNVVSYYAVSYPFTAIQQCSTKMWYFFFHTTNILPDVGNGTLAASSGSRVYRLVEDVSIAMYK
jgi:hypothetical protein